VSALLGWGYCGPPFGERNAMNKGLRGDLRLGDDSDKGTLGNTASVSATSPDDPVPGNNSSAPQIPVTPS